jgi:predicted nucleic acid-binding protein
VSRFVVDASVVLTWCFPDENSPFADKIAEKFRQGDSALAPSFWPHEVLNGLLVGEKRKRISQVQAKTFLSDLATLPVELRFLAGKDVFDHVQAISRRYALTAYDAAYFHLAEVSGLPLATLDEGLLKACRAASVPLVD